MANLILPRRFYSQPQHPVEVDRSNPLTRGLVYGVNFANQSRDFISGQQGAVTDSGTLTVAPGRSGIGVKSANGGRQVANPNDALRINSSGVSHLFLANISAIDNPWGTLFAVADAAGNASFTLQRGESSGALRIYRGSSGPHELTGGVAAVANGTDQVIVACSAGAVAGAAGKLWAGGVQVATGNLAVDASGQAGAGVNARYFLARNADYTYGADGTIYLHLVWNRYLDDAEIQALSVNPWQIFRRSPQVLYFDVAGGGITGTIGITLDNFATAFSGTTTVLGSIASTLGEATTALTGTTTVTGSIANTLGDATTVLEGDVGQTGPVGDIASNLGDSTASLAGTTAVVGTIGTTLEDSSTALTGTTTVVGTIANTLDDVVTFLYGFPGVQGLVARLRTMIGTGT